jgi:hypothetical protein
MRLLHASARDNTTNCLLAHCKEHTHTHTHTHAHTHTHRLDTLTPHPPRKKNHPHAHRRVVADRLTSHPRRCKSLFSRRWPWRRCTTVASSARYRACTMHESLHDTRASLQDHTLVAIGYRLLCIVTRVHSLSSPPLPTHCHTWPLIATPGHSSPPLPLTATPGHSWLTLALTNIDQSGCRALAY